MVFSVQKIKMPRPSGATFAAKINDSIPPKKIPWYSIPPTKAIPERTAEEMRMSLVVN